MYEDGLIRIFLCVYEGCLISNVNCSRYDNVLYDLVIDEFVE